MDQSHRIWQSNGSAAHAARSWNRRVGPIALPDRPSQTDALGPSWLFLQRNNSQTPQLLYKYEDRYPMLGILAGRPSTTNVVTCSTCFSRCRSGSAP